MPRTTSEGEVAQSAPRPRAPRSDAVRNRDKLLAAAAETFTGQDAAEASLEAIARSAGVGIGTLYRHFPTRAALIEAVYRNEVELLCADVDQLLAELPPDEAMARWMERFIGYVGVKRGLVTALKELLDAESETFAYCHGLVRGSIQRLVTAAADAGVICAQTEPDDLLRAMSGFCMSQNQSDWQERAVRLVSLLMDGLRYRAAARA